MNFKDQLHESEILKEIPRQIIQLIADNEYHILKSVMEDWYENKDTVYSSPSADDMFAKYIKKAETHSLS